MANRLITLQEAAEDIRQAIFAAADESERDGVSPEEFANRLVIAISDEMVEAAVRVLWESGAVEISSPGMDHLLVERMLVAAMQVLLPPKS